jgi:hypothetical protein
MPSTDTKPELTAKASVAQPVSQPAVYANGLTECCVYCIFIKGGPKVGTPSKSTFFVLYLSSLPSFTIPVKK